MDRRKAIQRGVALLREGDILLIAGKGHEKKQIIGGKTTEFDDVKVAEEIANGLV
jgi:UDP-N-acetylmuramoyl-L-alanyl-D-glutamate--2,6-diaminopimelate ligase